MLRRPGRFGAGDQLQVGLLPGRRVLLPDDEWHREALSDTGPSGHSGLAERPGLASVLAESGLLAAALPHPCAVVLTGDDSLVASIAQDLLRHRIDVLTKRPTRCRPELLTVVVSDGEPDRVDAGQRSFQDDPALYVALIDGRIRLGPMVAPGHTSCLGCLDAHLSDADPWHRDAVHLYARPTPDQHRSTAHLRPSFLSWASLWVAEEIARWYAGSRPLSWSATILLDPEAAPQTQHWPTHPHCGCGWQRLG